MSQYKRTPIGQLEYRAKYEESQRAVAILGEQMAALFERVKRTMPPKPFCLSYIPSTSHKQFDLPRELVQTLVRKLGAAGINGTLPIVVHPELTMDKPDLKGLAWPDKIAAWRSLQHSNAIKLSRPVTDRTVVVIDDLYQSGATLWSYAAYLKSAGAAGVVGMVCVKSCRDTDNL
jgi:predicted amidophosphoribosyltransferase